MKLESRQRRSSTNYLVAHAAELQLGKLFLGWGSKKRSRRRKTRRDHHTPPIPAQPSAKNTERKQSRAHPQLKKTTSSAELNPDTLKFNDKAIHTARHTRGDARGTRATSQSPSSPVPLRDTDTPLSHTDTPQTFIDHDVCCDNYNTSENISTPVRHCISPAPKAHRMRQRRYNPVAPNPCQSVATSRLTTARKRRYETNAQPAHHEQQAHLLIRLLNGKTIGITTSQAISVRDLRQSIAPALPPQTSKAPMLLILNGHTLAPDNAALGSFLDAPHAVIHVISAAR